ncbi:MAG: prepilin-type N-terminal cleavage/methylation domain-containing protein [Thermodesulfovibrionales bacterium]
MFQSKLQGQQGVTLVEVLISLVILLVVFVGLIQTSILSIEHNMRNSVRDGAVSAVNETISELKAKDYSDSLLTVSYVLGAAPVYVQPFVTPNTVGWTTISKTVGNYVQGYSIGKAVASLDPATDLNKQVTVQVRYIYRDDPPVTLSVNTTMRAKPK